jgi:ketosteroid isomerase-like protein
MTTDEIRSLLLRSYEAYNKGDRAFVLELFHDDIEWVFNRPSESLPFPNRVAGKFAVLAALKQIDAVVETVSVAVERAVVEGDTAFIIADNTVRQRSTARIVRYKSAALHRYRDGKLIEYITFADGFDLMQQLLGREIAVPPAFPVKG